MNYFRILVFTLAASLSAAVFAGSGIVEIESQSGTEIAGMVFAYQGNDLARMSYKSGKGAASSSIIMRDGKVYSVMESDAEPVVIDMAELGKMMKSSMDRNQDSDFFYSTLVSLDNTGKQEKIAGIKGDVYTMVWDDNGTQRSSTIVLSKDKKVVAYTRAWINFGDRMAQIFDIKRGEQNDLRNEFVDKKVGILRLDDQFVLSSVSTEKPPASMFELPSAPVSMGGMDALGKMFDDAAAQSEDSDTKGEEKEGLWGAIGKKFDRQVNRQKERSDDVVDDATDKAADESVGAAVDKAVDKVFDIFK